jgi:UDP-glucuronate decarboxylase
MNFVKRKKLKDIQLLEILNNVDLKRITNKEANFFNNKKILITGVSGIIGINLLFFFNSININKKIRLKIDGIFNTSIFPFVKNYFKKNKNVKFYKIDLTKKRLDLNRKYDLIFHCAGYGQPAKFMKYKSSTFKLNSLTIMNLKNNLKTKGKFLYMSTTELYSGNKNLCSEISVGNTTTLHPRSSYIESKKFGESFLINCFDNYLIYRVCLTYGPGAKINDERILNILLLRSIKKKQIDIFGGLSQLRSNLYISDAINMIIKSTVKYKNEIFNISNHNRTTINKMAQIISNISNKKVKKYKNFLKGSPDIIKISNRKILRSINLQISTSLKDGLLKTYKWYLNLSS